MKKLLTVVAALSLLAAPFACNLNLNSFQANKVMVGTLLSTPTIQVDALELYGTLADGGITGLPHDGGSIPTVDGGSLDAGMNPNEDGGLLSPEVRTISIPGQTTAYVFFGSRKSTALNSAPSGVTGAVVRADGTSLTEIGEGNYRATSSDDGGVTYVSGKDYAFSVEFEGQTFTGSVKQLPPSERIETFHPASGILTVSANAPLTFERAAIEGTARPLGFVTIVPFDENGNQSAPTYTNMPQTPLEFLQLIAAPDKWKTAAITIPASAFPTPKSNYLIVFQSAKLGGPDSDNLFVGSAFIAGTSDIAVVRTK